MRLNSDFVMQEMNGEVLLVPVGEAGQNFHGVIRLNTTAAFIVKQLQEGANKVSLIKALDAEYDGTPEQFEKAVDDTITVLNEVGAVIF